MFRAQLFGGLMAFENQWWLPSFGLESPGTERDSGAAVKPANTARNFALSHFSEGFHQIPIMGVAAHLGLRCRSHPSAAIPVVQLKARSGIAGAPAERAHGPRKRFSALAHQHTRTLAHRAPGRLAKFRISPIFSQPRRADYRRRPVSVDRAASGSASRCGPTRRRDR